MKSSSSLDLARVTVGQAEMLYAVFLWVTCLKGNGCVGMRGDDLKMQCASQAMVMSWWVFLGQDAHSCAVYMGARLQWIKGAVSRQVIVYEQWALTAPEKTSHFLLSMSRR